MKSSIVAPLSALASGAIFGVGVTVAGLGDPSSIVGALDVGGEWDPSLWLATAAAITFSAIGLVLATHRPRAWIGTPIELPRRRDVSARLVVRSVVLGVGWGLTGFSPSSALVAIGTGNLEALLFTGAMLIAMLVARTVDARFSRTTILPVS